jgi:hypothetical protein
LALAWVGYASIAQAILHRLVRLEVNCCSAYLGLSVGGAIPTVTEGAGESISRVKGAA